MSSLFAAMSASVSGMSVQSTRLRLGSENIANADTPGYRRKLVPFTQISNAPETAGVVQAGQVQLDQSDRERIFDPAHPMAGSDGYYDGSNVNLMVEIADAREAQRSYEANLKMFDQARQMETALLDLLKR